MEDDSKYTKVAGPSGVSESSTAILPDSSNDLAWRFRRDTSHEQTSFRSLRKALGDFGSLSIMGGTVTTLGIMGFLVFLWTGEGQDEGQNSLSTWRYIILEQWITQAITLSSVILRITNAAQASVCTGFIASMAIERYGVPLSRVAEYSLMRSNNDGPMRLSWLMLTSFRHSSVVQTLLVVFLLLGATATQFTSTILVSDLRTSLIISNARNVSTGISATSGTLEQFHLVNQYFLKPVFLPFGEIPGSGASPTTTGVSDTGIVKRIHPFIQRDNRTSVREYQGRSFVFNSRIVCLPPSIPEPILQAESLDNPSFTLTFLPYLSGKINYTTTLDSSEIGLPEGCTDATCFPSAFNCSLAVQTIPGGPPALSACIPSGRNAILPSYNSTISQDPVANTSEVFLFVRSNVSYNATIDNGTAGLPVQTSSDNEWTTYKFGRGISMDVSLCFQQLHYDRAFVELSTSQDLADGNVQWNANTSHWDTSSVQRLFGTMNGTQILDPTIRGIYSVGDINNSTRSSTTSYITSVMITDSYSSFEDGNVTMLLSPYSGGSALVFPHVEYQALFADILEETNRPAIAFQNLITALSGSIIDSLLTQLDIMEDILTVSAVSVSAPQSWLGLSFVLTITAVNLTVVVVVVSLFLTRTNYSSQGNYWHAIAQIVSDITHPIIHRATQATDEEITHMLRDYDFEVRLERRGLTGRVEVVRYDEDVT